jgi:hypothetical protein
MPHTPTPWVGLAALLAMFVIPFLPTWLFEGPRTIKHRPRRHIWRLPGTLDQRSQLHCRGRCGLFTAAW